MGDTIRRKVTIAEGRVTCTVTEFDDGAVIVDASYPDDAEQPSGNASLHVSAPDRASARRWCDVILHALRQTTQGTISG